MYITSYISLPSLLKDFSELKDPVAFPDSIRKPEISIEGAQHKQEVFNRYQKEKKKINKLISILTEDTELLNLQMTMVQWFLKPKEKHMKKNLKPELTKTKTFWIAWKIFKWS